MFVGDFVFVVGVEVDAFFGGDVVVDAEDRAGWADVVPETVGDDGLAPNPGGEVDRVEIAEGADDGVVEVGEALEEGGDLGVWAGGGNFDGSAIIT